MLAVDETTSDEPQTLMTQVRSLPPIASENSKILILGSMPGEESLRVGQYYANARNKFWHIMGELFGAGLSFPYDQRVKRLQSAGVAIWDVLRECQREGSLDASITAEVANDFPDFFNEYPNITHVFFNGEKAERAFRCHTLPWLTGAQHKFQRLPSTSPAHAAMTIEEKVNAWWVVRAALSG